MGCEPGLCGKDEGRPLEVWWLDCWMLKSEPALGMLVQKRDQVKEFVTLKRSAPQLKS